MKRTDIINSLIKKYNYKSYLEIGVKNPGNNFNLILVENKDGVDPNWKSNPLSGNKFEITSDDFFDQIDRDKRYDLVFIDGLHTTEQVDRDVINTLEYLNSNGAIVLHDCNPPTENMQNRPPKGTGDVWKSIFKIRCLRLYLSVFVVDTDFGVGVIRKGKQELYKIDSTIKNYLNWKYFSNNRKEILNLISVQEYKKWLKN